MKKVLNLTLYGNYNYGNKLQNFAVQRKLESLGIKSYTLIDDKNDRGQEKVKSIIKKGLSRFDKKYKREARFKEFDQHINKIETGKLQEHEFDFICVGSDQVWNYRDKQCYKILKYIETTKIKNIFSLSASFGCSSMEKKYYKKYAALNKLKNISVREESGKELIEKLISRQDSTVLLDPTMLIDLQCWNEISRRPRQMNGKKWKNQKYILNYFLGELNTKERNQIEKIARENNCRIINILDKNDPFYTCGPSEFIWLEQNAFLICTDSFHSCVFAILYRNPFIVFNRHDGQKGINSMNSRIETLLEKFGLENRYYKDEVSNEYLTYDYFNRDSVLRREREKADRFLKHALKRSID